MLWGDGKNIPRLYKKYRLKIKLFAKWNNKWMVDVSPFHLVLWEHSTLEYSTGKVLLFMRCDGVRTFKRQSK